MLEELAAKVTGNHRAFVYYIEGDDGPEYKLLVPGQYPSQYLGASEEEAEAALNAGQR